MGHALNTIWCKYAAVAQCSLSEEKDLVCNNTDLNFKRLKKKKESKQKTPYIMWYNKKCGYCWYHRNMRDDVSIL